MREQTQSAHISNERLTSRHPPLQQAERRLRCRVVLEFAYDFAADQDLLTRVPKKIADQPDRIRRPEFDKHHQVGDRRFQSWMNRVPDALPAVDAAFRPYLFPSEIEAMTGMADPFRTPLRDRSRNIAGSSTSGVEPSQ
jgi:hypothetical protein